MTFCVYLYAVVITATWNSEQLIISVQLIFFFPFPGCSGPLGIEGGIVSNQQITASSTHRALFGLQKWYPYYARLNKKGLVNAWTAAENDRWPWIQVTDGAEEGKKILDSIASVT